jgi:hypothetical protein
MTNQEQNWKWLQLACERADPYPDANPPLRPVVWPLGPGDGHR